MPKTLSADLRERIVRHVAEGHSRRKAAEKFAVSVSSAVRIVARHAATGSVAPQVRRTGQRSKLEAHRDYLVQRIGETPDITLPELAADLAARGTRIDPSNLSRWFIRNGYRFKKNTAGQRAGSARHPPGARGVGCQASAEDAA